VNRRSPVESASFAGYRFPPEVILLAVRWYLRYGLSYRDVEDSSPSAASKFDHVTIYRWVQRFTPMLIDAARPCLWGPNIRSRTLTSGKAADDGEL